MASIDIGFIRGIRPHIYRHSLKKLMNNVISPRVAIVLMLLLLFTGPGAWITLALAPFFLIWMICRNLSAPTFTVGDIPGDLLRVGLAAVLGVLAYFFWFKLWPAFLDLLFK